MDGVERYRENAITTQSPGHLVVMLVEGAIRFLKKAIDELEAGDLGEKGDCIIRAMEILVELDLDLDMEAGGQIAQNLRSLYDFMRRHLALANIKKDPEMIREVISMLEDLNAGWKGIAG